MNDVTFTQDIADMILANLDGWVLEPVPEEVETNENTEEELETEPATDDVAPFMTSSEATSKHNKMITCEECKLFYEEALDLAYMHTNRLNVDDLTEMEVRVFIRAVCKWAASNLWNKYNIRVNNEDMEDTYVQSYGGLLYKSALKTLNQFINQRITNLSSRNKNDDVDDVWIM